jgi:hypothetical protein
VTLTRRLHWPNRRYTAWRGWNHDDVFHSSAPGMNGEARCGAAVDVPLAAPALGAPDCGVVLDFLTAVAIRPAYPGDTEPRVPCVECMAISGRDRR